MPLCYGGGDQRPPEQAQPIIKLGFEKVSVSAAALERPKLVREDGRRSRQAERGRHAWT